MALVKIFMSKRELQNPTVIEPVSLDGGGTVGNTMLLWINLNLLPFDTKKWSSKIVLKNKS